MRFVRSLLGITRLIARGRRVSGINLSFEWIIDDLMCREMWVTRFPVVHLEVYEQANRLTLIMVD